MANNHYDIIIVGTGAGGGTLLHKLADTGKKILVIEKGGYIPKEKENWDTKEVFIKGRYKTKEAWYDKNGDAFVPGQHYCVGGNTKVYGAALFRLREEDFGEIVHHGGVSPAWPISYSDLKDYYQEAENLYHVNGERGSDPTEPNEVRPYIHSAIKHEPRIQKLYDDLTSFGLKPFPLPIGVKKIKTDDSELVLDRFDGYPDPTESKGDSHVVGVKPNTTRENVTIWTDCDVQRFETENARNKISKVVAIKDGQEISATAGVYCLCAGAINSAAILLKSKNDKHPNGLANGSDQVGRNYMCHNNTAMLALSVKPNPTIFGKTFAINDYYYSSDDFQYPLGHIQMLGKSDPVMFEEEAPFFTPGITLKYLAEHALDFWLTSEDLPDKDNRVIIKDGKLHLHYTENNLEGHNRLEKKLRYALEHAGCTKHLIPNHIYLDKKIPIGGVAHQCGTVVMGDDPETSVLNSYCQSHEVNNLFVVDGGFFPSSAAVNPALTIMAMALRVGDFINENISKSEV